MTKALTRAIILRFRLKNFFNKPKSGKNWSQKETFFMKLLRKTIFLRLAQDLFRTINIFGKLVNFISKTRQLS